MPVSNFDDRLNSLIFPVYFNILTMQNNILIIKFDTLRIPALITVMEQKRKQNRHKCIQHHY